MKISCNNVSFYDLIRTRQFWEENLVFSTATGQWHHITICLLRVSPIQSYTITVWFFMPLSFFTHYSHKVMDEYRRCRHRSIKFQTLTGVMKSASWQEQVFLLYHFSLPLQSSILSIIRNKKKTRENCCTLLELAHPSYRFLWIFMTMLNNPYKYWNTWALNFLHDIASNLDSFYLFYTFETYVSIYLFLKKHLKIFKCNSVF